MRVSKDNILILLVVLALPVLALAGGFSSAPSTAGASGSAGLPSGCTDNTIARADGTAGATQCSGVVVTDTGNVTLPAYGQVNNGTGSGTAAVMIGGGEIYMVAGNANQFDFKANSVLLGRPTTVPIQIQSQNADGASAVGIRLAAYPDYTTAGAKILSIGDNAGVSYSEKAYVDYTGRANFAGLDLGANTLVSTSTVAAANFQFNGTGDSIIVDGTNAAYFKDSSNNTLVTIGDDGTSGYLAPAPEAFSIADNGAGSAATSTDLPNSSVILVTCNDAHGCEWTPTETSAVNGILVKIVNVGSNTLTIKHSAGAVQLNGANDEALGQYDSLDLIYSSSASAWIQSGATGNN